MSEQSFNTLVNTLIKIQGNETQGLRNITAQGFSFDGIADNYQDLYDYCDRSAIIEKMKGLLSAQNVPAAKWCPLKLQCDFMASIERDLRTRYRSRLDQYRYATLGKGFSSANLVNLQNQINTIVPPSS